MKNLSLLVSEDGVRDYVRELWKTDEFRRLHDLRESYLRQIVDVFAAKPRIFYEMTDSTLERNHFTAWVNAIQRREDYTNSYLSDMYYLHEMRHLTTLRYDSCSSIEEWSKRSLENELDATIETEVVVYFAVPGLREKTFPFEIWADRFLYNNVLLSEKDMDNQTFFQADPEEFRCALAKERSRVRECPIPGDRIEEHIAGYVARNREWDEIWKGKVQEIEERMERFEQNCLTDREYAIKSLAYWLLTQQGTAPCPFHEQAVAYNRISENFKQKFYDQSVEVAQKVTMM